MPAWGWVAIGAAAFVALVLWLRRGGVGGGPRADREHANDPLNEPEDEGFGRAADGVVVLRGNVWDDCEIDGLREPWSRFTAEPTEGLAGVPCGRHRVRTRTPNGEAVLDFTLHAGDVIVRRLDAQAARWTREEAEVETDVRARAEGGAKGAMAEALLSYKTAVGMARVAQGTVRAPDRAVEAALRELARQLDAAEAGHGAAAADEARKIGAALVGVPLTERQLATIWRSAADRAAAAATCGDVAKARALLRVGLAVLPEERNLAERLGRLEETG